MQVIQGPLAAFLSVSLVVASTPGFAIEPGPSNTARPVYHAQVQGTERILHALNRFTFGPRPGDLDAVRAEGLDRWFEQQLHPAAMNNSVLQTKLAEYPAMQLSPEQLLVRFPNYAIIRQVIDGKVAMPASGILHTVYANQTERIREKREEKAQKPIADKAMGAGTPNMAMDTAMSTATSGINPLNFTPDQINAVLVLAPRERVAHLAAMPQPRLDSFFRSLKGPQREALLNDLTPDLRETLGDLEAPERTIAAELMAQHLTREIFSEAQLQEVMTDFWLNHFNVYLRKNEATPYYLVSYERDVIRPRALGHFEDLLEAVAHSPAMLLYLDNAESMGPDSPAAARAQIAAMRSPNRKKPVPQGLNENYARELMELHTLGVNGGYTQADVIQAARILTGWTVEQPQRGGGFQFNPNRHEPGTKKVMGHKFKEHGEQEGRELLHFLATRPATAQFICHKLAVRFVSDDPPQALVERMAKAYLSSNGDISTVLLTLYRSPEFWSQDVYRAKVKTPLEYIVSAARASNANVVHAQPLIEALREMGMPLYGCIPPTGYKEDAADWVSTGALVNRMNFALSLAANHLNGIVTNLGTPPMRSNTAQGWESTASPLVPESEETRLEHLLIPGGLSDNTRSAVLQQLEQQSTTQPQSVNVAIASKQQRPPTPQQIEKQNQLLAGLLLGSPEFQRR